MGKIIGIFFGLLLGSRFGIAGPVLGFVVGYWFDKGLKSHFYIHPNRFNEKTKQQNQQSYQQYEQPQYERETSHEKTDLLSSAYRTLNITTQTSHEEVKKAYRKMTSKYHPDKFAAIALPEDMLALATKRTRDIREAYELICKHRGWHV